MAHQLCYVALKNPSHFASAHCVCVCVQCKVCDMYIVRHLVGIVPLNLGTTIHHQFNRHHCKWDHPQKSYLQTNIYIAQNCHLSLECLQHWKIMNLPLSSAIIIVLIVLYISAPYLALQEVQVYLFLLVVYIESVMKILVSVTF